MPGGMRLSSLENFEGCGESLKSSILFFISMVVGRDRI